MEPMDVQLHDDLEPEPSLVDLNESLDDANSRVPPEEGQPSQKEPKTVRAN
ncbi:hypothetical protein DPMN_019046 [Dreissena polymorpha]|uniref:Uncharacterized protein n=1 Tax=Dreissena polymorpha TaxID=45954 RepID=A0A9D4S7U5_DREPO|nr:hypothetical protein DPMN_019046 [Dreissena polymorpha]